MLKLNLEKDLLVVEQVKDFGASVVIAVTNGYTIVVNYLVSIIVNVPGVGVTYD